MASECSAVSSPLASKGNSRNKRNKKLANVNNNAPDSERNVDLVPGTPYTFLRSTGRVADWDEFLKNLDSLEWVCPVEFFPNAPFATIWKDFAKIGTKVEVLHPQSYGTLKVNCLATIIAFAGYKALIVFERTKKGPDVVAWMSLCSSLPKPVGHSIRSETLLLPVVPNDGDGFEQLVESNQNLIQIVGQSASPADLTISETHEEIVRQELEKFQSQITINDIVEVMDSDEPLQNRLACVTQIVGDRIKIRYIDAPETGIGGYCFNVNSEFVHPLGWSHAVGQTLKNFPKGNVTFPSISKNLFPKCPDAKITNKMVFEVRHPLHPHDIACGRVKRRLAHGYFEAKILNSDPSKAGEFVFHITSDYILPVNFSRQHKVPLVPPQNFFGDEFLWEKYLAANGCIPLDLYSRPKKPVHKFVKGCKFEAVDACQPLYHGPATVLNIAGHLLYIHFDGWSRDKLDCSQWISAFSPDIYPTGWAEMVGHSFQSQAEAPKVNDSWTINSK